MDSSLWGMSAFALIGAITPGPVNILALRHGAAPNPWIPALFVLGASLSYMLVVWLMGAGAQHTLQGHPTWMRGAQWLGAAYLLYLAAKIATAPAAAHPKVHGAMDSGMRGLGALAQGAAVQTLNPKAWLWALSGVGLFAASSTDAATRLRLFCGISLVACTLGVGVWVVAGHSLAHWLNAPQRQVWVNRVLAALLTLTVAGMLA